MRRLLASLAMAALLTSTSAVAGGFKRPATSATALGKSSTSVKSSTTSSSKSLKSSSSSKKTSKFNLKKALAAAKASPKKSGLVGKVSEPEIVETLTTSAAIGAAAATTAAITISTPCANTDISPTASACAGFVAGNIINNGGGPADPVTGFSPNETLMAELLAQLGFTYTGDENGIEQFDANSGTTVDFATLLSGTTIIGIHYGNGVGSPGGQGSGNDTAFYRFDAGLGLNTFDLAFNSASTVTLFQTGVAGPVPEPSTWAMMLFGFGAVGFAMRRRRRPGLLSQIA